MSRAIWLASFLAAFAVTSGQDVEICSCAPGSYEFTFDFSLVCPPVNVTRNGGVSSTFCVTNPFGGVNDTITDFVPVTVTSVTILELGEDSTNLVQTEYDGDYFDGDTIEYTSVIFEANSTLMYPRIIQVNTFALNAAGQPIVGFFAISFTNNCSVYPAFEIGDSAGWTQFTMLGPPPPGVCTAFDALPSPTSEPTVATPSPTPVTAPPAVGSASPTIASGVPTFVSASPTIMTIAPTVISNGPTKAPTVSTPEPTDGTNFTNAPTPGDTFTPVPTDFFSSAPSAGNATFEPTAAPTTVPESSVPTVAVPTTTVPTVVVPTTAPTTTVPTTAPPTVLPTMSPTEFPTVTTEPTTLVPPTIAPTGFPSVTPTMFMFSMDYSMSMSMEYSMSMDYSMSMSMDYDMIDMWKDIEFGTKAPKSAKSSKSSKSAKSAKSAKSEKAKSAKSAKSEKAKSAKSAKSEKAKSAKSEGKGKDGGKGSKKDASTKSAKVVTPYADSKGSKKEPSAKSAKVASPYPAPYTTPKDMDEPETKDAKKGTAKEDTVDTKKGGRRRRLRIHHVDE